jgi:Transposase DDE domain
MSQDNTTAPVRVWHDSAHASLCVLGSYLRRTNFFQPLEQHLQIQQKTLKYTPVQKVEMFLVALLAGAKAVSQTNLTLGVDAALCRAFGLPGCADQSVIAATLNAATPADVTALQAALGDIFQRFSQARRQDLTKALLVLDVDLSPLPASRQAEGSERGYMGRCRSKTGRKLVRVRAAHSQETVWETVVSGRTAESLSVLQEALTHAEQRLGLEGEDESAQARRGRVELRLDSGWGSEAMITWLLARGYQVTGKFKSTSRVRKLVRGITAWQATSSPGREVARIPEPVPFARPLAQYAVRTPSKEKAGGYYQAVLFTTRTELGMRAVVDHYDDRAGIEADLKSDKGGLGLAVIRKQRLAAQMLVVLLVQLAHNLLIWSRRWLTTQAPRLAKYGIIRLVQEVWAIPGRIKLSAEAVQRVRLCRDHPRARDVCCGFRPFLAPCQTLELW